ncbi:MAG: amidase, partial [Muribaculaceae bacterium]|nr:amidase [Muribaculaceae bacterium]
GKELWIRRLLSPTHLYSSAFNIKDWGDTLLLNGRGWGHGVGLCQIGAANMALHGYNYREILSFYYPGSNLTVI